MSSYCPSHVPHIREFALQVCVVSSAFEYHHVDAFVSLVLRQHEWKLSKPKICLSNINSWRIFYFNLLQCRCKNWFPTFEKFTQLEGIIATNTADAKAQRSINWLNKSSTSSSAESFYIHSVKCFSYSSLAADFSFNHSRAFDRNRHNKMPHEKQWGEKQRFWIADLHTITFEM